MHRTIWPIILSVFTAACMLSAGSGVGISAPGFLTSLPPDAPELAAPEDGITDVGNEITLSWTGRPHSASFTLQISGSHDFNELTVDETGITDTLFMAAGLETDQTLFWRVCAENASGTGAFSETRQFSTIVTVNVEKNDPALPERFALHPAYPNPFNPVTSVTFDLPEDAEVTLWIINSRGQCIRDLVSGSRKAGTHVIQWDARDNRGIAVTSGMYFCVLKTDRLSMTRKMLLMR
ncbi:T9SS type A sorting domain-containing protein [bacterium]|nr:T9SS type A sorting domain-containing protein [bacterium]